MSQITHQLDKGLRSEENTGLFENSISSESDSSKKNRGPLDISDMRGLEDLKLGRKTPDGLI